LLSLANVHSFRALEVLPGAIPSPPLRYFTSKAFRIPPYARSAELTQLQALLSYSKPATTYLDEFGFLPRRFSPHLTAFEKTYMYSKNPSQKP
jgi:hypothetical protein